MKTLLILSSMIALGSVAIAHEKAMNDPKCQSIVKSCEAAGYMPGEHKKDGKGLWIDCVHAIAKGKTVAGVTASQDEAKACAEAARADHKENKAEREAKKEQKK